MKLPAVGQRPKVGMFLIGLTASEQALMVEDALCPVTAPSGNRLPRVVKIISDGTRSEGGTLLFDLYLSCGHIHQIGASTLLVPTRDADHCWRSIGEACYCGNCHPSELKPQEWIPL
jgi:hypothetical protein